MESVGRAEPRNPEAMRMRDLVYGVAELKQLRNEIAELYEKITLRSGKLKLQLDLVVDKYFTPDFGIRITYDRNGTGQGKMVELRGVEIAALMQYLETHFKIRAQ